MIIFSVVLLALGLLVLPVRARAADRAGWLVRHGSTDGLGRLVSDLRGTLSSSGAAATATFCVAALLGAGLAKGVYALPVAAGAGFVAVFARKYLQRAYRQRKSPGAGERLDAAASWDLLAAGLRAGLAVPEAIRAIIDGLPEQAADALRATADLLALGADPDKAWEPALSYPPTAELARAARRTALSGAALAAVATDLATRERAQLSDRAEEEAQRAGVLIAGPLGLCFLPAFICLGIIPVVIGLADQLTVLSG